jgi:SPP1 family predicted phage head-tail adaptor
MNLNGKTFNPGQMRTQIILKLRTVSDTGGFQVPSHVTIATVWARWNNLHGSEVWAADATGAIEPATAVIRYRTDVDATCAVEKDGKLYEIVSIDDIEDRHEYIELKLKRITEG